MKSWLIIILICATGVYSLAQSFDEIDQTKNFYAFQFGASPEDIPGRLHLDLTISYGVKYYKYQGALLKQLYGYRSSQINLGFRDDKLEYLDIYFDRLNEEEFQDILTHLQDQYGSSISFVTDQPGVLEAEEWQGKEMIMQFYRYDDSAIDHDDRNQTVLTLSLKKK